MGKFPFEAVGMLARIAASPSRIAAMPARREDFTDYDGAAISFRRPCFSQRPVHRGSYQSDGGHRPHGHRNTRADSPASNCPCGSRPLARKKRPVRTAVLIWSVSRLRAGTSSRLGHICAKAG